MEKYQKYFHPVKHQKKWWLFPDQVIPSVPDEVENHKHFHFIKLLKKMAPQRIFDCIITKILIQ
ncbi:hypothetical protein AFK68_21565 [Hydrocoleum sp. CS-953]|nr:hypothetical protein AFK68_21565 [Hydrocoleum sp. CS-953]